MRRKPVRRRDEAQIDITPMLDIVFIMLIFFLVTTSFVKETAIELRNLSKNSGQVVDKKDVILIDIDAGNVVFVNGRQHDIRFVRAAVQAALAADPAAQVVLVADREAGSGMVVRAVDQARLAGAADVSLAAMAQPGSGD